MSRRKQGRPQQRKTLDSLEQEKDLLVCGDCQAKFPLHDIVHFIRHKKLCCADKENLDDCHGDSSSSHSGDDDDGEKILRDDDGGDDDDNDDAEEERDREKEREKEGRERVEENGDVPTDLSAKTKRDGEKDGKKDGGVRRTSTQSNGEDKEGDRHRSRSASSSSCPPVCREARDAREGMEPRPPLKLKLVDAESNTTHSEPSKFQCTTCRSTYTSAWALLQHAQKEHGMKIYTSPSTTPTPSSVSSSHSNSNGNTSSTSQSNPHSTRTAISPMDLASPRPSVDRHHSVPGSSPYPLHPHHHNPFTSPFRLPLDARLQHPTSLGHFARPPAYDLDLINDYRLRNQQFMSRGQLGMEHHPAAMHHFDPRARPPHMAGVDTPYDLAWSMRLKQLAGSPAVPAKASPFPGSLPPTPRGATTPTTSSKPESPSVERTSVGGSPRGSTASIASAASPGIVTPKHKCEFCGKSFRFKSNLVVHRRSHTGEKPFRCPLCPHACTQQSKLKRHMKTHSVKPDGSGDLQGDVKNEAADDDDEEDEEEEDELEDEEMDEDMGEEEMNEEEREVLERMKAEHRRASSNSEDVNSEREPGEIVPEKRIKLEIDHPEEQDDQPSDLSMKPSTTRGSKPSSSVESLLSEVMENSGLTNIESYKEAYQAALAESKVNGKEDDERSNSVKSSTEKDNNDTEDNKDVPDSSDSPHHRHSPKKESSDKKRDHREKDNASKEKEHVFLGNTDILNKAQKRDAAGIPTTWPASMPSLVSSHMDPILAQSAAAYASRMYHPMFHPGSPDMRLFIPGYGVPPPRFPHLTPEAHAHHNGLTLGSPVPISSSSALLKPDNAMNSMNSMNSMNAMSSLFKPSLSSPSFPHHHAPRRSSSSASPTRNLLLQGTGLGPNPPKRDRSRNDTCEYCGKIFKNCSNLTVHRRSHTGEKPYKCNLCSYACAQSSKLTRHMKTHGRLGKDVYTCKFCQMPFSVPSTLEKHMRKCVENRNARLMGHDVIDSDSEDESSHQMPSPSDMQPMSLVNHGTRPHSQDQPMALLTRPDPTSSLESFVAAHGGPMSALFKPAVSEAHMPFTGDLI